jgi:ATP-binding cassette subfamily B protein RaxB
VSADFIVNEAKEASRFLESLRAIQTLKASGAEAAREGLQRDPVATTLNSTIRMGNVDIGFNAVNQAVSGLTDILIVFLGLRPSCTPTSRSACWSPSMAYQRQFTSRFANLVENFIAWRLLDVHLDVSPTSRLPPRMKSPSSAVMRRSYGEIVLQDLAYRYAPSTRVRGVDLTIALGVRSDRRHVRLPQIHAHQDRRRALQAHARQRYDRRPAARPLERAESAQPDRPRRAG